MLTKLLHSAPVLLLLIPGAAPAAVVGFAGIVANTCTLTVATPGLMASDGSGTQLTSETSGGVDAIMSVVSTGNAPTISFAAPTLTGPAASTSGATKEIGFSSASGSSQGFIGTAVSTVLGRLNDTFTIKGHVVNSAGFVSGAYTLSTVVTCQQ